METICLQLWTLLDTQVGSRGGNARSPENGLEVESGYPPLDIARVLLDC